MALGHRGVVFALCALIGAAACDDSVVAPGDQLPPVRIRTDSASYLLNNKFGRIIDVYIDNPSSVVVPVAKCGEQVNLGLDWLSPTGWTPPPTLYYCPGDVLLVLRLQPGETLRATARFNAIGTFRLRAPIWTEGGFRYSAETSTPFEIR
jgi:hypothetical protein